MEQQTSLFLNASKKKQVPAKTIHDMNDKKISELTREEYDQVKEDWDVHFNDLDYRDGRFKLVPKGQVAIRYHDKAQAIMDFYALDGAANLFDGKKLFMTRDK